MELKDSAPCTLVFGIVVNGEKIFFGKSNSSVRPPNS